MQALQAHTTYTSRIIMISMDAKHRQTDVDVRVHVVYSLSVQYRSEQRKRFSECQVKRNEYTIPTHTKQQQVTKNERDLKALKVVKECHKLVWRRDIDRVGNTYTSGKLVAASLTI